MALTDDQLEILKHTAYRAAGGRYCGDSKAMQQLVSAGFMQSCGKVSWCPDEYFALTAAGRAALRENCARSVPISD